jgi:hypothetical protein
MAWTPYQSQHGGFTNDRHGDGVCPERTVDSH